MSQIRKSASFRSRIPVRERFPQRRCSSPQPVASTKSRKNRKTSKFFLDRYYSSSSFSSSDESNESDEPLQSLLKKSATTAAVMNTNVVSRSNLSTDGMSLNGLLDNVSCGSFSTQNSPPNTVHRDSKESPALSAIHHDYRAQLSSYESLDKLKCASDTLKMTDDYHQHKNHLINTINLNPSCEIIDTNESVPALPKHIQSLNHNYRTTSVDGDNNSTNSMKRQNQNCIDYDSIVKDNEEAQNKQKHLSDWYYIKTSPKPKPTSPYERRKAKNVSLHPPGKATQLLPSFDNRSSSDKIHQLNGDDEFAQIQKYRSNDYIQHHPLQQIHFDAETSPLQSHKCFSMKYSKSPAGRSDGTKFGDMTSSSFEQVNGNGWNFCLITGVQLFLLYYKHSFQLL